MDVRGINISGQPVPVEPQNDLTLRLAQLEPMLDAELISAEEFDAKKAEIPASM